MRRALTLAVLIAIFASPFVMFVRQAKANAVVPVGTVKVVFCPSWSTSSSSDLIYADLAVNWSLYGDYQLEFSDVGFPVTYQNLATTQADVVIVCDPAGASRQYSLSDADAIQEFLLTGNKGIFFSYMLKLGECNNSILAPLAGLKGSVLSPEFVACNNTYDIYEPTHPVFANVSNPWNSHGYPQSQNITVSSWSDAVFSGTKIVAETTDSKAAVIAYDNSEWRGVYATTMPDYKGNQTDKQFVYNSIVWLAHLTDAAPPVILIESPQNETYASLSVPLTFAVNKPTSWMGYSVDGQASTTIIQNATLPGLADGTHYVTVYANDTFGNIGVSKTVYFSIDTTYPSITDVSQYPLKDDVQPQDNVEVNATVTDSGSRVKQVILTYAAFNSSGSWIKTVDMTNIEGDIWSVTIPAFPYGTNVTYTVLAQDSVGNTVNSGKLGYKLQYPVVPESPTFTMIPVFIIATLLAATFYRRKHVGMK